METCWIIVGSMPQQVDQLSLPEVWKHAGSLWASNMLDHCDKLIGSAELANHKHLVCGY